MDNTMRLKRWFHTLPGMLSAMAVIITVITGLVVAAYQLKTATPIPQIDIQDGLIAYYPFNGNANDNSGNRNDGKIFGAVLTSDRKGNLRSAFEFDGIDNYIYVQGSESLNFTTKLTITVWIKTSRTLPFAGIVIKAPPNEPRNGYGLCVDDNQKIRADITWDHSIPINAVVVSEIKITDGRWYFVATTYDGEIARLYIDGLLQGAKAYRQGAGGNVEPLLIGWDRNTWLSHRHFEGIIDEVRLYNRALNEKELKYLMEQF